MAVSSDINTRSYSIVLLFDLVRRVPLLGASFLSLPTHSRTPRLMVYSAAALESQVVLQEVPVQEQVQVEF